MLDPFPVVDDKTTTTATVTDFMAGLADPLPFTPQALLAEIGLPIQVIRDLLASEAGASA